MPARCPQRRRRQGGGSSGGCAAGGCRHGFSPRRGGSMDGGRGAPQLASAGPSATCTALVHLAGSVCDPPTRPAPRQVHAFPRPVPPLGSLRVQCWCSINLATYFEGRAAEAQAAPAPAAPAASAAAGADQGDGGQAPPALAPPPALLLTAEQSVSSAGSIAGSSAAELGSAEAGSAGADAASAAAGPAAVAAPAAVPPGDASVGVGPADASSHQSGGGSSGGGGGGSSHGGHVLQDCWLPLADPGDAGRVCGRVRVSVRAASPAGLEQQLWRRLLVLAGRCDACSPACTAGDRLWLGLCSGRATCCARSNLVEQSRSRVPRHAGASLPAASVFLPT